MDLVQNWKKPRLLGYIEKLNEGQIVTKKKSEWIEKKEKGEKIVDGDENHKSNI